MRTLYRICIGILLTVGCLANAPAVAADDAGAFVGAGAYFSQVDEDLGVLFNDADNAFTAFIGWKFNDWLSIDAGYWDLGKYESDRLGGSFRIEAEVDAWTVGGVVGAPVGFVDLYLRGGMAFWEADSGVFDEDDSDPYYGFGLGFNLGDSLQIYGEWIRFDIAASIDTLGVGLRYFF